jgi:AraC-like DNA-binding protein
MPATNPRTILGKIAAGVDAALEARARSGAPAGMRGVVLAEGDGWEAADIICTAGPRDPVFEEQHGAVSVAVVVAGSFQYRTPRGLHLMTPGSLFLGNAGEYYECGHEHAAGDRCVSFRLTAQFVDGLAAELGTRRRTFGASRVPASRQSAATVAAISTAVAGGDAISWEEAALDVAALALRMSDGDSRAPGPPPRDLRERVTLAVREIERDPSVERELRTLAADAQLSAFQFLRAFRRLTGTTPHQYLIRARLRESAALLRSTDRRILDIALGCGFNDLSNFNHAFRAEFGLSPRAYRRRPAAHGRLGIASAGGVSEPIPATSS